MKRTIGIGKVVNGRITYTGEHGGFVRPVTKKEVVMPVVEEVNVLFSFKSKAMPKGEVVEFPARRESVDRVCEAIIDVVAPVGGAMMVVASKIARPFSRYFMDGEDVREIVRKKA